MTLAQQLTSNLEVDIWLATLGVRTQAATAAPRSQAREANAFPLSHGVE